MFPCAAVEIHEDQVCQAGTNVGPQDVVAQTAQHFDLQFTDLPGGIGGPAANVTQRGPVVSRAQIEINEHVARFDAVSCTLSSPRPVSAEKRTLPSAAGSISSLIRSSLAPVRTSTFRSEPTCVSATSVGPAAPVVSCTLGHLKSPDWERR